MANPGRKDKARAKEIIFTDDELITLVWAINNHYAKQSRLLAQSRKKQSESETIQRLLSISKKAYGKLIDTKPSL